MYYTKVAKHYYLHNYNYFLGNFIHVHVHKAKELFSFAFIISMCYETNWHIMHLYYETNWYGMLHVMVSF